MWEAFSHNLKDPAGAAIPFFLLFMFIEMAAVRREEREDRLHAGLSGARESEAAGEVKVKGYLKDDTRASLTMFFGSIGFSAAFRTAAFPRRPRATSLRDPFICHAYC